MKLRRFAALAGALVMTLSVAGSAFADSGSPTSVNASVDGLTVTLKGAWAWDAASCKDSSKKMVGWAVAWGEPGYTSNPVPKSGGGSYFMGDAASGNTIPTDGTLCAEITGSWGPISHTYAEAGKYDICVIIYDVREPASENHSKLAGGPDRNKDNSVEENFLEGESICLSPEFPVVVEKDPGISIDKTVNPTQLPAAGGNVTYSYLVTNTGNVDLFDVKVTDDAGTPGDTSDDAAFPVVCPEDQLAVGESMTCKAEDIAFAANATDADIVTTNIGTVNADWDDCTDGCHEAVEPDSDNATVTVTAPSAVSTAVPIASPSEGVLAATDNPTAPPTDGLATPITDVGGGLPLLLIALGVIGLGAVVLTPGRAKR